VSALADTIAGAVAKSGRLGADLQVLLDVAPGLAGLGLFVELCEDQGDGIAYTDGKRLVVSPKYWALPARQRLGVLAHELLHVGLAHPLRGQRLQRDDAHYIHELWNIACDANINHAVSAMRSVELPSSAIQIEKLEAAYSVKLIGRSAEQIYAVLKSHMPRCSACGGFHLPPSGGGPTASTTDSSQSDICGEQRGDSLSGDVRAPGQRFDPSEGNEQIERWGHRTTAGIGSMRGVGERLRGDIPKVTTPWEAILRSFLRRFCGVRVERDYRRPHRRWLAGVPASQAKGFISPLHFGTKRGRAGRLAVVVDTSGSIDNDLLGRFTGEIISIMRQTGAHVRFIVADAAVLQVEDFVGTSGIARLSAFRYEGGGGTDFAPAIAQATEWQPDALLYLTDLHGSFGAKPKFPVLWAVCPEGSVEQPPFGQRIDLR
jgi:predicted metal-dependent peptidase